MRERNRWKPAVWMATGGGIGYLPWAPGTWGSGVGLLLGLLAVRVVQPPLSVVGLLLLCPLCAAVCTRAERALGRHDAPPIVLDEIVGMAAILLALPSVAASPVLLLTGFAAFRAFDIVKPPPLRRLATLPAGWGILADDLGASLYTLLLLKVLSVLAYSV